MLSSTTFSLLALATISHAATTNQWETYPEVPKTATINGFADPVYDVTPECARKCLDEDTGSTPCPYWDTGCLCVMSNWSGAVAQCVAEACQGQNVEAFTSIATSQCSKVGVPSPYWFIPDSASSALAKAADAEATTTDEDTETPTTTSTTPENTTTSSSTPAQTTTTDGDDDDEPKTTTAPETTSTSSPAANEDSNTTQSNGSDDSDNGDDAPANSAPEAQESSPAESAPEAQESAQESAPAESAPAESTPAVDVQTNGAAIKGASFAAGVAAFVALI